MTLYKWSQTASADATADSSINWQEGQAPSSVNDSARGMMAATAKFRDDIAGAITTGGTSSAYTLSSYQVFDTLAHLSGQMVAFTPHATNAGTCTLNVDSLGAKALRSAPSTELPAGTLIAGTPYVALYNNSDSAFYLHGLFGNPYTVPIGGMIDFAGTSAPNSSFVFPTGQAISRTTYATLFSLVSTTYGTGDGSTTFNLPDLTGRVVAMKEASATRLTSTYFGGNSANLGATGGLESTTLTLAQLPTGITSTGSISVLSTTADIFIAPSGIADAQTAPGTPNSRLAASTTASRTNVTSTGTANLTSNNTSGAAHRTVQPTIILNKLIRII